MASSHSTSALTPPSLRPREFQQFRELAYRHFGLDLRDGKQGLIASRLAKPLRELGLRSFADYYRHVTSDSNGAALTSMVDRLTTNHTSFFREPAHFVFLRSIVFPHLRHRSSIHIWSAACSTGEEPYSIAMSLLEEAPREAAAKIRIKATDISTRALAKARGATYEASRIAAIPAPLQLRYMAASPEFAAHMRFTGAVRSMVCFDWLNLMSPLPAGYRASVIFCRNVMIYFDRATRQALLHRLAQHLEDGGYLFVGHAETLNDMAHNLVYVCPSIYRKPSLTQQPNGSG